MQSLLRFILLGSIPITLAACNGPTEQDDPRQPVKFFPAADVCSYPAGGPGKLFRNLGGGAWAAANAAEPTAGFECVGSNKVVQLWDSSEGKIEIEYSARGSEKGANMITLAYTVTGVEPIPNESTYRNAFLNLAAAVARQSLGKEPDDYFRKRISNLRSYLPPGKSSPDTFDLGDGFILLNRNATSDGLGIEITAKLYPDVELKLKN